jgi:hypothetical protein
VRVCRTEKKLKKEKEIKLNKKKQQQDACSL